ncbi:MAG: hypothetical protein ACLFTU_02930 [Puniceicoccaceae bacterium]
MISFPRILVLVFSVAASPLLACGPYFDRWILDEGEAAWAAPPYLPLHTEIRLAIKERAPEFHSADVDPETARLAGLLAFLQQTAAPPERRAEVIQAYQQARAITAGREAAGGESLQAPLEEFSEDLPRGFLLYLRGAFFYRTLRSDREDLAREAWETLIDEKPPGFDQRLVWTHYMLGRLTHETDPVYARRHFRKARAAAAEGYPDPLGLAAASYGWEARTHFRQQDYGTALELYLQGNACGAEDIPSIVWSLSRAFGQSDETLAGYAADPGLRRLMSAWIASADTRFRDAEKITRTRRRWLGILRKFDRHHPASIDHLALISYQAGDLEEARHWCSLGSPGTLANRWLTAKLNLAEGDLESAALNYSQAIALLRSNENPDGTGGATVADLTLGNEGPLQRLSGELGLIRLERRDYREALRLLAPHYWEDAAFLAERCLTTDELLALVDLHYPEGTSLETPPSLPRESTTGRMRYLLARRLARENRLDEAIPFYPAPGTVAKTDFDPAATARRLSELLKKAEDARFSNEVRAGAFEEAARLTRGHGLELMGTELEPDWAVHQGQFTRDPATGPERRENSRILETLFADRSDIMRNSAPAPDRRFHYRYRAAEYGWQAALLLPDNDSRTARILWQSGRWLMHRDPQAADRFYKALVRRNPGTPLGAAADALRWFPARIPGSPPDASSDPPKENRPPRQPAAFRLHQLSPL